jgi:hypothetical protein
MGLLSKIVISFWGWSLFSTNEEYKLLATIVTYHPLKTSKGCHLTWQPF